MNDITIHNKKFEVFINEEEIRKIVLNMAESINKSKIKDPLFIAILNGSFLFTADLLRNIKTPNTEISFLKLSSYIGTESSGKVEKLIGLNNDISNRNIIILEDIIDTGVTLESLLNLLKKENVNDIKVATLLFKPNAYKKNFKIDYVGKSIDNNFVVGYGLDYNELGRNLKHIYKLKN